MAAESGEDAKSRLRQLYGEEGLARLEASTVVVFGVGGVGASCAEALVRGGVGNLAFVDGDEVQLSNVNRQAIAFQSTVGRRKVDVMCAMAHDIYPEVRVCGIDEFVLPGNLADVMGRLPDGIDYLIDAIDTVATKLALALYAQEHGLPLISSMGAANKADPTKLEFADLFQTRNCPLSKAMRKRARAVGVRGLQVLYSSEEPFVPDAADPTAVDGSSPGASACAADGSHDIRRSLGTTSYMPPIMGQMIAGFVIRAILERS